MLLLVFSLFVFLYKFFLLICQTQIEFISLHVFGDLVVVHCWNSSLDFLVECDHLSTLVLCSDSEKVFVVGSIPATVCTANISDLFVNGVHLLLDLGYL